MAPQRSRVALEDSRSEASSSKEKQIAPMPTKARRNGSNAVARSSLKDVMVALAPVDVEPDAHDNSSGVCQYPSIVEDIFTKISLMCKQINWSSFELSVLHAYRQAHRLNTPSAFSSSFNQRILSRPGIGWSSPTMAVHKNRRRISKDNLALAVRKDFKDAMVHESDAITSFLYSVHNQGQYLTPTSSLLSSFLRKTKTSACALLRLGRNKMPAAMCSSMARGSG